MSRLMMCVCPPWLMLTSLPQVQADAAEDKAVAFVEKLRGKVTRDEKHPGQPVIHVELVGRAVTAEMVKELAALKHLVGLSLFGREVTDAGLKELALLKGLTSLSLHDTKVTAAGLKELVSLTKLTSLDLFATPVTDAGMKEIGSQKPHKPRPRQV